jgi:uncharacterized protein YggE
MRKISLLLALLLPLSQLFAADPKPLTLASVDQRTVTVDAIAVAKTQPDKIEWFIEIRTTKPTVKESRAAVDVSLQRLLSALKAAGVKDDALSISNVDQGRDMEWTDRKRIFKGFYSSLTLRLSVTDFKLLGRINSEILADDLLEVKWMARRSNLEGELRQKALADAAQVARKKAEALAGMLGAKVGDVLRINETSFADSTPYGNRFSNSVQMASQTEGNSEDTAQIMEIAVRASINVTFELVK